MTERVDHRPTMLPEITTDLPTSFKPYTVPGFPHHPRVHTIAREHTTCTHARTHSLRTRIHGARYSGQHARGCRALHVPSPEPSAATHSDAGHQGWTALGHVLCRVATCSDTLQRVCASATRCTPMQTFKSVDGSGKEAKATQEELLVWCALVPPVWPGSLAPHPFVAYSRVPTSRERTRK